MRAARFVGGGRVEVVDVPRPVPGPGEVLVRVDPGPLLTHRFPLEGLQAACDAFWSGHTGKVLVEP